MRAISTSTRSGARVPSSLPTTSIRLVRRNFVSNESSVKLVNDRLVGSLIDEAAQKYHDRDAFRDIHQRIRWTFKEVKKQVDRHAAGLIQARTRPRDRLGMYLENEAENYVTHLAANRAGVTFVSVAPSASASDVGEVLRRANLRGLVLSEEFIEPMRKLVPELYSDEILRDPGLPLRSLRFPNLRAPIQTGKTRVPGFLTYREVFLKDAYPDPLPRRVSGLTPADHSSVIYSADLRGAAFSHSALLNAGIQYGAGVGLSINERVLHLLPLYTAPGQTCGTIACLYYGSFMIIPSARFDPLTAIKAIDAEKPSLIQGTPEQLRAILAHPVLAKSSLDSVRKVVVFGSSTWGFADVALLSGLSRSFTGVQIFLATCVDESAAPVFIRDATSEPDAKQLGPAAAQHEVRVEADGSVSLRGPALLSEFLDSPEETRRVRSPDGWVRSTALRLHSPAPNQFALAE